MIAIFNVPESVRYVAGGRGRHKTREHKIVVNLANMVSAVPHGDNQTKLTMVNGDTHVINIELSHFAAMLDF